MKSVSFMLLSFIPPGKPIRPIAVLVLDSDEGTLHWRFRDDWDVFADPDDVEVLAGLADDFVGKIQDLGPEGFLAYLEKALSNSIQITERKPISIDSVDAAVDTLFESLVAHH